jgi:hypothetical protein
MTHGSNKKNFEIFSAGEFIAAITQHIPRSISGTLGSAQSAGSPICSELPIVATTTVQHRGGSCLQLDRRRLDAV